MLSADEMQTSVSSLRHAGAVGLASKLYSTLDSLSAPRFANRRLHLPCIAFSVKQVRRQPRQGQETYTTYEVKADGLRDLLITTEDKLVQFSQARPIPQTFLLVLPWNRSLLELPDFAELPDSAEPSHSLDESQSMEDYSTPLESPLHDSSMSSAEKGTDDSESHSRALRLIVRLGQPFGAFLLAQQRGGEYKRIASDHDIIAQAKDVASVNGMM
ncbi:uncharacterized protein EDB91DRAFT_1152917, partial [Suillus paluster]|uniref:uncharacterized protein n=1 Tax=Suillus paluster TaxID=48578 RepID=UPI001B86EF19